MTQGHFVVADLLLQDDNAEVRTLAAECVGIALQMGYPPSPEKAMTVLWEMTTSRFKTSAEFALQLLEKLIREQEIGEYVEIRCLLETELSCFLEQLRTECQSSSGELFAEEPANIYIEPYYRRQRLFDAFCALDHKARELAVQDSRDRIQKCSSIAKSLADGVQENRSPLDKRREPLIMLKQILSILDAVND